MSLIQSDFYEYVTVNVKLINVTIEKKSDLHFFSDMKVYNCLIK